MEAQTNYSLRAELRGHEEDVGSRQDTKPLGDAMNEVCRRIYVSTTVDAISFPVSAVGSRGHVLRTGHSDRIKRQDGQALG